MSRRNRVADRRLAESQAAAMRKRRETVEADRRRETLARPMLSHVVRGRTAHGAWTHRCPSPATPALCNSEQFTVGEKHWRASRPALIGRAAKTLKITQLGMICDRNHRCRCLVSCCVTATSGQPMARTAMDARVVSCRQDPATRSSHHTARAAVAHEARPTRRSIVDIVAMRARP